MTVITTIIANSPMSASDVDSPSGMQIPVTRDRSPDGRQYREAIYIKCKQARSRPTDDVQSVVAKKSRRGAETRLDNLV